jgi:choline dehydrogenase-like flavoprotein
MIVDAAELPANSPLKAEVCIAGAGAVGISMALELADAGIDVLLLEAGGTDKTEESQEAYRGSVVDDALHGPLEAFRWRKLGGTSGAWNGRCVPYDPIDFEERPWMQDSHWPIAYDDVAKYFPLANRYLEAGHADYSSLSTFGPNQPEMIEGFHGDAFSTDTMERFSAPTDLGWRYREKLAASSKIHVVLHAPLQEIGLDESGTTATSLLVRKPDGTTIPVEAQRIVLAAGGLETVRLLLANNKVQKNGIGNANDMVGRFYMAHIAGTIGSFAPKGKIFNDYQRDYDGVYCRRRLALKPEAQREHHVGGFIARLHHTRISDPSHGSGVLSALRLGRVMVPKQWRGRLIDEANTTAELVHHAWNVARDIQGIASFTRQMIFDRKLAERKYPSVVVQPRGRRYSLDFHAEQEPNYSSVVRLAAEKDAFGMPRLEVDWHYTPMDLKTIEVSLKLFGEDAVASGAGAYDYDPTSVLKEMTRYGAYGGHHLGTVRMGTSPTRSVVDADCRVHGMTNLFVAGGSVFATSSQANPTLTIVALALRLADHLKAVAA